MAAMNPVNPAQKETASSFTRVTREGKKLHYELTVIQQPERARACGQGAKSSADRRPVDPPPVVELQIFEVDANGKNEEITFRYNANFFLFATLEHARAIAKPHGAQPMSHPVLTGTPVAGIAYFDRPRAAGYFVFPDLSVRHEGKYRLIFNLFEEVKDEKNIDAEPQPNLSEPPQNAYPGTPSTTSCFYPRLEVKSEPFNVYSAKKFPGLNESTQLSRLIAEQGCRVRIRRDVRMRRRDNKAEKDFDGYDEEKAYPRPDRYVTPDGYSHQVMERPRSVSHGSIDGSNGYSVEPRRRSSVETMGYYNHSSYPQPPTPQSGANGYSHLGFGGSSASHYQTPQLPMSHQQMNQPMTSYPPQTHSSYQYQQPAPPPRQMTTTPNYGYSTSQSYMQPPVTPHSRSDSQEYRSAPDYRRASVPQTPTYMQNSSGSYQSSDSNYSGVSVPSYYNQNSLPAQASVQAPNTAAPASNSHPLPPLKTFQSNERNYDTSNSIMSAPAISMPAQPYDQPKPVAYSAPSTSIPEYTPRSSLQKRPYGNAFDQSHLSQPLHSGMRPGNAAMGQDPAFSYSDGLDEAGIYDLTMQYKRADGRTARKKCPSPKD
ncbi:MAG: velvet protein [Cirrosporium novae-zelandiae]|nr:MAG: velvet protein [Cirrosporium novae-zelandiae]